VDTPDVLHRSIRHTHDVLADRLDGARAMIATPGQPRKNFEDVDTFLAMTSKHLSAVDAVLVPAAQRLVPDGAVLVHEYVRSERDLEIALTHVKARAYGSTYEAGRPWSVEWSDVADALSRQRTSEDGLADRLADTLDGPALDDLTERLHRAESTGWTRPHPYAPHTGLAGKVSRRVMHTVDAFWDETEGRMVPVPDRPRREKPGLFTQYFLADPRFEEEEPPPE